MREPITLRLGQSSEPIAMVSWSPLDNYILIAYEGSCKLKVYELRDGAYGNRVEDWQFNFNQRANATSIQHAIWSPDEKAVLLHPKNTNQLHLMTLKNYTRQLQNSLPTRVSLAVREDIDEVEADIEDRLDGSVLFSMLAWSLRDRVAGLIEGLMPSLFSPPILEQKDIAFSLKLPLTLDEIKRAHDQNSKIVPRGQTEPEYVTSEIHFEPCAPNLIVVVY